MKILYTDRIFNYSIPMKLIDRLIVPNLLASLKQGRSVLLLGPRQTGKTTLMEELIRPDISLSLADPETRLRFEKNIGLFRQEIEAAAEDHKKRPLVFVDEIQKLPLLMDAIQYLIDKKTAQFILSGSSARKLRHGTQINLLPGRVNYLHLDSLTYEEIKKYRKISINDLLIFGSLPNIITNDNKNERELNLQSYATTYLEEEVRLEALVRNVGQFARFLEIAADEAGAQINFTKLSQVIGIADTTIANYFQILEDCLIIDRIEPILKNPKKRRLTRTAKYLFFDLGVQRVCCQQGDRLSEKQLSYLFEQYIGVECLRYSRLQTQRTTLRYWRDATTGQEIDFVIEQGKTLIPIEVKWSKHPTQKEAKHLAVFMGEYGCKTGYIACRAEKPYQLDKNIKVIPWQNLYASLFKKR